MKILFVFIFLVFFYSPLKAQMAIDKLIFSIASENMSIKERLNALETLKRESFKLEEEQKTKLLNIIPALPLNLSASLTKWLIDSENINNYDELKKNLFSIIIHALENKIDNPDDIMSLLNSFILISGQTKQTFAYSTQDKNYFLAISDAFYKYLENDESDHMFKTLFLSPILKSNELDYLKKEKLEIWQIQTPNLSNLILLIRHQTDKKQRQYNTLLLSKAKNMSDVTFVLTILNIFNANPDFLFLFRREEIDVLVEFLSHEDKTVVGLAEELLSQILHIDRTVDIARWWKQNKDGFDFNSHIKKIILNPKINLRERANAISQLCAFSDTQKYSEDIDFLLKIAKDENAGDIRGSAAFAIRDHLATEELVQLIKDFLEQKHWQRMAMHIVANTKYQLKDKLIEQKIKQILCDENEEERTIIYYALPALSKITSHKKTTAMLILDLVEKVPTLKDNNSPNTLQVPVYNALQHLIGTTVNNDLILLRKAISAMPDDPPEEEEGK